MFPYNAALLLFMLFLGGCGGTVERPPVVADLPALTYLSGATTDSFALCASCPPGFELVEGTRCVGRNLYQLYLSPQKVGVGGPQTALPPARDGFSPQQIDLGRLLFFDPVLSGNGKLSCATCHDPDKGFSDGLACSIGINGTEVKRSAPTLWNVAYLKKFFWDARASSLEDQAKGPLYSEDEMGSSWELIDEKLNRLPVYRRMFAEAFGRHSLARITEHEVLTAISAFESSLISLNSRYDQYAHGYHSALTEEEIAGMNVFRSFVARCAECHTPPLFTNQQLAVIGTPEPEGKGFDIGAEEPLNDSTQKGGFKVPSLRNIALTAPYFHSGRFSTLLETVEFYTLGRGHAVPDTLDLKIHWHIWEPNLSDMELGLLVKFLGTLTDESFKPQRPTKLPSGLTPSYLSTPEKNPS